AQRRQTDRGAGGRHACERRRAPDCPLQGNRASGPARQCQRLRAVQRARKGNVGPGRRPAGIRGVHGDRASGQRPRAGPRRRAPGSVKVTALTVMPPVLLARPIVMPLKPSVSAAISVVVRLKVPAPPPSPIVVEAVLGCRVMAPVLVMVFAVVFKTMLSVVML